MQEMVRSTVEEFSLPGLVVRNHKFDAPLNYADRAQGNINVFARELVALEKKDDKQLPWLLMLNGGPGFECVRAEGASGWIQAALKEFRVLLLDQRGTGLSSAVTHENVPAMGDAATQARYLSHFRADNIVRDCELIRAHLAGGEPWTVLGQSFGGFCTTTYLSHAPEGLRGAIITGGLPPVTAHIDDVYRATYRQVIKKNREYYQRFPQDAEIVRDVVKHLQSNDVALPSGEQLTPERFLSLGINFGFKSAGTSMATVHFLLERAFADGSRKRLSFAFLHGIESLLSFNTNPVYAVLHEAIYCEGNASNWSAERKLAEFEEFSHKHEPPFFTGEMIYRWMFDQYANLRPFKDAAEIIAQDASWPALYDAKVLRSNTVPCVASVYYDDMYVDRELSLETAAHIKGIKLWITNEYEHDGIRADGDKVVGRLLDMLKGNI
jgi:pimeloyl-ACP methyl ester carboxylesterase